MSDFEKVLDEYKEQTKPMCEALGCIDSLDDFLVDIELSRAKYHHFYQAGQQSQQAKIDELQGRIDEALRFYNEAKSPHNIGMIQMAIYLKGNKDENY